MRSINAQADYMLDVPVKVLDNGYVIPIDYMGDDLRIVRAARVSTGNDEKDKDVIGNAKLINYLMKNSHWSPFEMVEIVWKIRLPIFVMRQLVRHRTANINEMSGRYTELPTDFYFPDDEHINPQAKSNKQGRTNTTYDEMRLEAIKTELTSDFSHSEEGYKFLLASDVAKELARIVLPVSTYTEIYWKCDLRNIFNFLRLRLDGHAQYEIRVYAEAMAPFVQAVCPLAYDAFEEYILYAKTFSRTELSKMELK